MKRVLEVAFSKYYTKLQIALSNIAYTSASHYLVTDCACLDPLVGLQMALGQVEAARLQQALALRLAVALQRDLVLQEVDDLLIPRGRDLVLAVLKMLCAFVFKYFGLKMFTSEAFIQNFASALTCSSLASASSCQDSFAFSKLTSLIS